MKKDIKLLLLLTFLLTVLNVADILTTHVALQNPNLMEGNPYAMPTFWPWILMKLFAVPFFCSVLYLLYRWIEGNEIAEFLILLALAYMNLFYIRVVLNNVWLILTV